MAGVEETIRSQPLDGIVALGNCDKTVPAYLMALASADIPALIVTGGFRVPATWHVPSNEPRSQRQVIEDLAAAAGSGPVRVRAIPSAAVQAMGLAWPLMRELRETEYQFRDDFIMDSSAAQETFRLAPTPWDEIVAATIRPGAR